MPRWKVEVDSRQILLLLLLALKILVPFLCRVLVSVLWCVLRSELRLWLLTWCLLFSSPCVVMPVNMMCVLLVSSSTVIGAPRITALSSSLCRVRRTRPLCNVVLTVPRFLISLVSLLL